MYCDSIWKILTLLDHEYSSFRFFGCMIIPDRFYRILIGVTDLPQFKQPFVVLGPLPCSKGHWIPTWMQSWKLPTLTSTGKRISFVLEAGSNNFNLCASDIIKLVVGPRCSLHTVAGWLMNGMSFLEQDFGWKGSSKTSWVHTHAHLYTALIHKKAHKPK